MAKKQKCPEFENHERWLVAYADMMTLLFAVFVVLYAISNVEKEKLAKAAASIQRAFGISEVETEEEGKLPQGNSTSRGILEKNKGNTLRESQLTKIKRVHALAIDTDMNRLKSQIEERLYGNKSFGNNTQSKDRVVFVNRDHDGIRVSLLARKFFPPNQITIDESAKAMLDQLAASLKDMGRVIRVEGHTDNVPFNIKGMTNWELSSVRAASVVRYFVDKHSFTPQSMYAAGFGDTQPIAANDTPENRALNRRVDLKILYDIQKNVDEAKDE